MGETVNKFKSQHIFPEDIYDQIKKLDESKSLSGDIPTKIIKESIHVYCNQLTDCFNTSIWNYLFPGNLKLGVLTPIFKDVEKSSKQTTDPFVYCHHYLMSPTNHIQTNISLYM